MRQKLPPANSTQAVAAWLQSQCLSPESVATVMQIYHAMQADSSGPVIIQVHR